MTIQERGLIKNLLSDMLPPNHVSLNTKRINFIHGQGVIIYNETFAVEVYVPRNQNEEMAFFAIQRHGGKINNLGDYYRKLKVINYFDLQPSSALCKQFDEAVFQHHSIEVVDPPCKISKLSSNDNLTPDALVMDITFKKRRNRVA